MLTSMDAVLIAARRKMIASSFVLPLIGVDIGKDAPGNTWDDGWIFRAEGNSAAPARNPANSGMAAVTMHLRDSWSSPSQYHTSRYRQLKIQIYADQTRPDGSNNLIAMRDAELRCDRIATAIIQEFHDVANRDTAWPNNITLAGPCQLYSDLQIVDVVNNDGLVEGQLSFALQLM